MGKESAFEIIDKAKTYSELLKKIYCFLGDNLITIIP